MPQRIAINANVHSLEGVTQPGDIIIIVRSQFKKLIPLNFPPALDCPTTQCSSYYCTMLPPDMVTSGGRDQDPVGGLPGFCRSLGPETGSSSEREASHAPWSAVTFFGTVYRSSMGLKETGTSRAYIRSVLPPRMDMMAFVVSCEVRSFGMAMVSDAVIVSCLHCLEENKKKKL